MEIANIEKEIQNLLGLKIKKEILYEWLNELRNKPGFDSSNIINFLRTIVGFIALKEVDLKAVVENEIFEMKLINQEFEVF